MKKAERTRKKITDTFLKLAIENDELPNISQICLSIDLNRSTFYNYFSGINELIEEIGNDVLNESYDAYEYAKDYAEKYKHTDKFKLEDALVYILKKAEENRNAYLVLTSPKWNFSFKEYLKQGIYDLVMSMFKDNKIENAYIAEFVAEGTISTQYKWLHDQDIARVEFLKFFSHVNNLIRN